MINDVALLVDQESAACLIDRNLGNGFLEQVHGNVHSDDADGVFAIEIRDDVRDHFNAQVRVVVRIHPHGLSGRHGDVVPADVLQVILFVKAHVSRD